MSAEDVVLRFFKACEVDYPTMCQAFRDHMTEDFTWIQAGFPTCHGANESIAMMDRFRAATGYACWQVEAAVAGAVRLLGGLDVLVNNAGIEHTSPLTQQDAAIFDQIMAVNLRGVFLGMKHAAPAIGASGGGAIVNISSIAALGAIAL